MGQVADSSPGREWHKVPQGGQSGSSVKFPGHRDVAEIQKMTGNDNEGQVSWG